MMRNLTNLKFLALDGNSLLKPNGCPTDSNDRMRYDGKGMSHHSFAACEAANFCFLAPRMSHRSIRGRGGCFHKKQ